jgi:flagellar motor switch protein FliM
MLSDTSALSNILTQEEIDALLEPQANERKTFPQDLLKNAPPARKYPKLEEHLDALCRSLISTLRTTTQSENIRIDVQSFIFGQLGAYLDTLPTPSMLGFYQVNEWKQSILTTFDFNLSYCLLDIILGGRRGPSAMSVDGRAYTSIEKNILRGVFKQFSDDFSKIFETSFCFENMDTNPKTALIASPACDIIIARLEVTLDKRKGLMDIIFPSHLLPHIQKQENDEKFSAFSEDLALAVLKVPLELKAVLDKKEIPFKEVLQWKVGDKLPLSYFEDKPIELFSQNKMLFKGSLQVKKKTISVQIEKRIKKDD